MSSLHYAFHFWLKSSDSLRWIFFISVRNPFQLSHLFAFWCTTLLTGWKRTTIKTLSFSRLILQSRPSARFDLQQDETRRKNEIARSERVWQKLKLKLGAIKMHDTISFSHQITLLHFSHREWMCEMKNCNSRENEEITERDKNEWR